MLDEKTSVLVMDAINKKIGEKIFSLEDIGRMKLVPNDTRNGSYIVLSLQHGDLTILALLQFECGRCICRVTTVAW